MAPSKTVRAFIAISLPPAVKEMLGRLAGDLAGQTLSGVVRWVKPEAMHLTLRFLGDTAVTQLPIIADSLNQIAAQHSPFALTTAELGCFPSPKRPRVIWIGVKTDGDALTNLKQALDEQLALLGWPPERKPFHPHLTLGRVKDNQARLSLPWGNPKERESWPVTAVHLIQSELLPGGSKYTVRGTAVLRS
jgi:RNA 2',3'-cyclic 3'-phosphodiesterase